MLICTLRVSCDIGLGVIIYLGEVEAIGEIDASSTKCYFFVSKLECLLVSAVGSGESEVVHDIANV